MPAIYGFAHTPKASMHVAREGGCLHANVCARQGMPLSSRSATMFGGTKRLATATRKPLSARSSHIKVQAVFERFSQRAINTVMAAQQKAKYLGYAEVGTEHILLGMVTAESEHPSLFGAVTADDATEAVNKVSGRRRVKSEASSELPFTRNAKLVFEAALTESKTMGMSMITPEHICIALCKSKNTGAIRALQTLGVSPAAVKAEAVKRMKVDKGDDQKKAATASTRNTQGTKALDQFCRDLTREAAEGKVDPVIGREEEIHRVCQILARRKKNNPILLGEPGVGKTAIATGLALAIATGGSVNGAPLPDVLHDVRILQLDSGLLLAGAKERGELESRVTRLIAELTESRGRAVLVVDEIHSVVGAGSVGRGGGGGGGGLDVSNLLKPALATGVIRVIGATTLKEHRLHFEKDTALSRRFQPVMVNEPNNADALGVLLGLVGRYEAHHCVSYTPEALEAAVELSKRYIQDRFLPDKAIDVIDEAGSRARIEAYHACCSADAARDTHKLQELMQVLEVKDECVREARFEEATLLRERELDLKDRLVAPPEMAATISLVDVGDIERIVAQWTGIPVERMTQSHAARLAELPSHLNTRVIGQEDAVRSVSTALQRSRCGLKDPNRPISTLLFCGPTGVGKTCLTTELAEHLFDSKESIIRLDMSEYMERHSVSKLIGAPPGYIGFGEGGRLTEAVRRRPFSIVLLDEIEKAHPDVFHLMLQIFEDGRLTDSQGRVVSFKNCLIILTSNVGSDVIAKGGAGGVGFQLNDFGDVTQEHEKIKELVTDELKGYFRPEFLNRLDDIVVFNKLRDVHVRAIASRILSETVDRVAALGIDVFFTESAMQAVCATGFDIAQGARQLRRTIVRLIEDPLSDELLRGDVAAGGSVIMDEQDGEIVVLKAKSSPVSAEQGVELVDFVVPADVVLEKETVNVKA